MRKCCHSVSKLTIAHEVFLLLIVGQLLHASMASITPISVSLLSFGLWLGAGDVEAVEEDARRVLAKQRRCGMTLDWIPFILSISDLIYGLASGMTIK